MPSSGHELEGNSKSNLSSPNLEVFFMTTDCMAAGTTIERHRPAKCLQ